MAVILELLTEPIREPRESANAHSQRQVLALNKTGRNVLPIRIAAQDADPSPNQPEGLYRVSDFSEGAPYSFISIA